MSNITFTITCAIKTNVTTVTIDNTTTIVKTQVQNFFPDGEQSLTVNANDIVLVKNFYVKLQNGLEYGTLYGKDEFTAYLQTAHCCNVVLM